MYSDDELLSLYLKDIRKTDAEPIRSKKIEDEIILKAKAGSALSQKKIINSNLKYVIRVAKEYQNMGVPLPDLISAGNIGLIEAIDKYDPDRGATFLTCANQYIRCLIRNEISENGRMVKIPVGVLSDMRKKDKENQRLKNSELLPLDDVDESYGTIIHKSLNETYSNSDDSESDELINQITSNYETFNGLNLDTNSIITGNQDCEIKKMFHLLTKNEEYIVNKFFGFDCCAIPSFEDIGSEINLSTERTRQIFRSAIRKFRCYVMTENNVNILE